MAQEKTEKNEPDTEVSSDNENLPFGLTSSLTPNATESIVCVDDLICKALETIGYQNNYVEKREELEKSQDFLNQLNKPTSILTTINKVNMVDYLHEAPSSNSRKITTPIGSNKGLNFQSVTNAIKRLEYNIENQRLESLRFEDAKQNVSSLGHSISRELFREGVMYENRNASNNKYFSNYINNKPPSEVTMSKEYSTIQKVEQYINDLVKEMWTKSHESQKKYNLQQSPESFNKSNRPPVIPKTAQTLMIQKNTSFVCDLKHTNLSSLLLCDWKHTNMSSLFDLEQTNLSSVCDLKQINPSSVSDLEQINQFLVYDIKHSNSSSLCDLERTNMWPESDLKSSDCLERKNMFPLNSWQDSMSKAYLVKKDASVDSLEQICTLTNNLEQSSHTISNDVVENLTTDYPGAKQVAGYIKNIIQILIKPELVNQDILKNLEKITNSIDVIRNLNEMLNCGINTIFIELRELNRTYRYVYDTFVLLDFNRLSYLKIKGIDVRVFGQGLLLDLENLKIKTSLLFRDYNMFRLNFLQNSYSFASIPFEFLFLDKEKLWISSLALIAAQKICDDFRNKKDLEERHMVINAVRYKLLECVEDFKKCLGTLNILSKKE